MLVLLLLTLTPLRPVTNISAGLVNGNSNITDLNTAVTNISASLVDLNTALANISASLVELKNSISSTYGTFTNLSVTNSLNIYGVPFPILNGPYGNKSVTYSLKLEFDENRTPNLYWDK